MSTQTDSTGLIRIAFVCVQNAGRSQMAVSFGHRETEKRGLEADVELVTGGTRPADTVHDEVLQAMDAVGIDISTRSPREITSEEIRGSEYGVTMGCSTTDVCPAGWAGDNRDWDLDDPDGESSANVAQIRDEIQRRVSDLFDEIESTR